MIGVLVKRAWKRSVPQAPRGRCVSFGGDGAEQDPVAGTETQKPPMVAKSIGNDSHRRFVVKKLVAVAVAVLFAVSFAVGVSATKVGLMLEWYKNQTHTVFVVADALGYYADEGLEMEITAPGQDPGAPMRSLLAGRVQFAYTEPNFFFSQLLAGEDIVAFGAVLQKAPWVWFGFADTCAWQTPRDFVGLRMIDESNWPAGKAMAKLLQAWGVDPTRDVTWVGAAPGIQPLASGQIDVSEGYLQNEPYMVTAAGFDVGYLWMGDYFPDVYGGILMTTRSQIESDPETVRAFMRANARAMAFIVANPEQTAQIMHEQVPDLSYAECLAPIGLLTQKLYMNPVTGISGDMRLDAGRMMATQRWLYYIGEISGTVSLDGRLADGFAVAP
jgi:ABC-type nitrate/sulfonate/bicarbonate transport system substrate-binding protein